MDNSGIQRIELHLDVSDSLEALRWAREGQDAIEDALDELQDEGVTISAEKEPSSYDAGTRGVGLAAFAIAVAADAAADMLTSLLFKAVMSLFHRLHRPSGITLKSGTVEIRLDALESAVSIRERVHSWLANRPALEEPITMSVD